MKRRNFLKGAGVITILVAGGGVWRASEQGVFSQGQGPAYEPWKNWREETVQGPLALVRAGILAANPHNTQPWLFKVTDERIEVFADTNRNLGSFDPYLREMHLGLGCAVENILLAATANGYGAQVTLAQGRLELMSDANEALWVASIDLSPQQQQPGSLYQAIPKRHTNRGPYNLEQALSAESVQKMQQLVGDDPEIKVFLFTSTKQRSVFGNAVVKATEAIIADTNMVHDSQKWFRHNWSDIQKFRDGPTLDAAGLPPMVTTIAKMLPPSSAEAGHQYWLDATRDVHVATSPLFGLISVRDLYDRAQNLRAGQLWQRIHLWATTAGIAMQPINQPVEMVDRERQLGKAAESANTLALLTGDATWPATFAFRAGYPRRAAAASPRRADEQVLI